MDGVIEAGTGLLNESMLTGEEKPVSKVIGNKVFGGTMLARGTIIVRVTKLSENAVINQLIRLVESAQSKKAPIQHVADKISKYFVPFIVIMAILDWIIWFSIAYTRTDLIQHTLHDHNKSEFEFAFNFGISTLVVACPCALGLATPTAVMVGTGIAAGFGVLLKGGGEVLEKM